ncbi:MAG: metallophosphoesterase [Deltaproteobacteria bacterium]|nr:metallophosphoesterase [Deltaproteobacteria bacterium]
MTRHASATLPPADATDLGERLQLRFFRLFFRLLLAAITLGEWTVIARVLGRSGVTIAPAHHPLGIGGLYALNLILTRRLLRHPRDPILAVYAAFAFTSVFAAVVIAGAELAWLALRATAPLGLAFASIVPPADPARWQPVFDAGLDIALIAVAALFVFGFTYGRRALATTRTTISVAGLPAALAGFRIVHLSDLHLGAYLDREELTEHVARVNALAPDLVCITGDLVDRAVTCAELFPVLAGLRARHGVLVTLGNHDVAAGAAAVTEAFRTYTPFTVLRNARVDVERNGARLTIVGLDDLGRDWARGVLEHPALPALTADLPPERPLVVLTHRPDCFEQAAALGARLVLAGHTHGGQIGVPGLVGRRVRNFAELITRYDRGTFRSGGATLVVSNGLGFTGQPIRLFTPREIGCLDLHPA